ncbi:MAG: protein kinase [Myxococcota bacterium]
MSTAAPIRRTCQQCGATFRGDVGHCARDGSVLRAAGRDPLIGRKLRNGRYFVTRFVGEGSAGRVYRAKDLTNDGTVAIKVMFGELALMPDLLQRFYREAEASKQLHHPNVVSVIDAGFDDPNEPLFLVMDFVDGPSLTTFVAQHGPMSAAVAKPILAGINAGLAHAHEQGVLHRDLKPDNIIITSNHREARLVDFGVSRMTLAHAQPTLTSYGRVIGTPGFIAPEVLQGVPADQRSDLYSLGVTAHFAVTGQYPFVVDETTWIAETLGGLDLQYLKTIKDPTLKAWIGRLLAMDRELRPATAEIALHTLVEPVSLRMARSDGESSNDKRQRNTHRSTWLVATAGLAIGSVGIWASQSNLRQGQDKSVVSAQNPTSVSIKSVWPEATLSPIPIPGDNQPSALAPAGRAPKPILTKRPALPRPETPAQTPSAAKQTPLPRQTPSVQKTSVGQQRPLAQNATDIRKMPPAKKLPPVSPSDTPPPLNTPESMPTASAMIQRYKVLGQRLQASTGAQLDDLRRRYLDLPIADALRRPDRRFDIFSRILRLENEVDRRTAPDGK